MKKHIFGLAIFSFIVFAAAFTYGIFTHSEIAPITSIENDFTPKINRSDNFSSNIAQAVYSVKTEKLTWRGELPNEKAATHFTLWSVKGINHTFIGSIVIKNTADNYIHIPSELSQSLRKIAQSDNLYMIGASNDQKENDRFMLNAQNSVPVTIAHDE